MRHERNHPRDQRNVRNKFGNGMKTRSFSLVQPEHKFADSIRRCFGAKGRSRERCKGTQGRATV